MLGIYEPTNPDKNPKIKTLGIIGDMPKSAKLVPNAKLDNYVILCLSEDEDVYASDIKEENLYFYSQGYMTCWVMER